VSLISQDDNPIRLSLAVDWRILAFGFGLALTVTGL
jgi:hypothetical protein